MDNADKPAPQAKDTRTQSQKAADAIARLEKLKTEWERFESPEEIRKRRVRQAQILGEAMLRIGQLNVPAKWQRVMLAVAQEYKASEDDGSEGEQPENERWLATREQLEVDGWEFRMGAQGEERLHLPPND